jgi:hypothetical protein
MIRVSLVRGLLSAVVVATAGAATSWAQQTSNPPETLIRLTVAPAPAPKPALRYTLLPDLREMSPGNPIEGYLKCHLEQYRFVFDATELERRKSLLSRPLDEVPAADLPELGPSALAQADKAARLDNPDWQILLKLKSDGIYTLLPDVVALRDLARAMQARFRSEVARGRIEDAIRTAKTMFAMTRHVSAHPTLIGGLVALTNANLAISALEEMLELPDCPNLYWALTNLPDPLISIRTGCDGERIIMWALFRDLSETAPISAEQIKKFIDGLDSLLESPPNRPPGGIRAYLAARTRDEQKVSMARKHLVETGLLEANVKAFSADHVILLDEARRCQFRFDEIAKAMTVPAWQFEEFIEKFTPANREQAYFTDALLPMPALADVRRAHAGLEQRIALLRHVEALRMYAAEHSGVFPAKLAQLSVPLPVDPFSAKPFHYEQNDKRAHVRGAPPRTAPNNPAFRIHYEITLRN